MTAPSAPAPLSLHDALPIYLAAQLRQLQKMGGLGGVMGMLPGIGKMQKQLANAKIDEKMIGRQQAIISSILALASRSEEHTSELQSLRHLVCRLLLEKKKKT